MKELDINQIPSGGEDEWMEDEYESPNGGPPRKKLRLTKEQSRLLEGSFRQNHTLNPVSTSSVCFLVIFFFYSAKMFLIVFISTHGQIHALILSVMY